MPDSENFPNNGVESPTAEPRQSLRDAAESAWNEVVEDAPDDDDGGSEVDDSGQPRDEYGRFRSKGQDPGEAAAPEPPSPDDKITAPQQPDSPTQPAQAASSEAPANWSAQDRQTFQALPQQAQEFLLRRHSEMEGDYQRRVQAAGGAVQFASALAPIFSDPVIAGSLQHSGVDPLNAISQWAGFHRRAMDPNPQVRSQLLGELADRMGLVSPASNGQSPPGPQLSEKDLQDPVIRHFADTLGRALNETQSLRGEIQRIQSQTAEERQAQSLRATRWTVDQFGDETDAAGNRLRPDFDEALPALIEMYRLNPQLDIRQAYEEARWRTPSIRNRLIAQQQNGVQQRHAQERARQAARSNVRGTTSRVSSQPAANGEAKGLRAALEASADEVGF